MGLGDKFKKMFSSDTTTETQTNNSVETKSNEIIINSPLTGKVVDLSTIDDAAFASGVLGKGVAIEPTVGVAVSPVDGTVETLFKTNHAIGLVTESGAEILIHIGMDTVKLDGKHFTAKIAQGDVVKVGQPLVEFDIEAIKAEGYSLITPVVVTNSDNYDDVVFETGKDIEIKEELIKLS